MKIRDASAHCDIPCAVYDPGVAQYAALSLSLIHISEPTRPY